MYVYVLGTIAITVVAASIMMPVSSNIPPTPAFSKIISGNQNITSSSYDDALHLYTDGSIHIDFAGKVMVLQLGYPKADRMGGVHAGSCDVNHYVSGIDQTGHIVCMVLP